MELSMIGIYQLEFSSGDKYIGQSTNIDKRISSHKSSKGYNCPKLAKAFAQSQLVGHSVLEECSIEELNDREIHWISLLSPSLNVLPGGTSLAGMSHPRTKYSKEQIEEVVRLYLETDISPTEIASITDVHHSTVHDITKLRSHTWATDGKSMEEARTRRDHNKYFKVYDPDGKEHWVDNRTEFEKLHNCNISRLYKTRSGTNKAGWSLFPPNNTKYLLSSPEGTTLTVTLEEAKEIMKECDLPSYSRQRIIKGHVSKGWSMKEL
jgi:hypothetical protein